MKTQSTDPHDGSRNSNCGVLKYLTSSAALWFLFVLCGGVVFAVYYARIEYLPDIELSAALTYLVAASIIGSSLVVLLTLLLIVPGFVWAEYLTRDPSLKKAFCHNSDITPSKFASRLILPFFAFALVAHLILIFHYRWSFSLFVPIVMIKGWYMWSKEGRECANDTKTRRRICLAYAFRYGISVVAGLIATFTLFKLLGLTATMYRWEHFAICTVGVVSANTVVAVLWHRRQRVFALASAIAFALGLLVATDYFDPLPEKIVSTYGFGQHVQLIVSEDGYKALRAAKIGSNDDKIVPNDDKKVPNDDKTGPKVLDNVQILCRMGSNYFLKIGTRKMALRKSDVISWAVERKAD